MDEKVAVKRGRARSEASRTAILDATRDLTNELGFAHVTIEAIAARAHVGKPTIYRWWQSKNAILAECILGGEMMPEASSPATSPDGMRDNATEWFRAVLTYVDENAPLLRGLSAAAFEDPMIAAQLNSVLMKPVEAAVQEWAGEGDPDLLPEGQISAEALAQLMFGLILLRIGPGATSDNHSAEDVVEALMSRVRASPSRPERGRR